MTVPAASRDLPVPLVPPMSTARVVFVFDCLLELFVIASFLPRLYKPTNSNLNLLIVKLSRELARRVAGAWVSEARAFTEVVGSEPPSLLSLLTITVEAAVAAVAVSSLCFRRDERSIAAS